MHGDDPAALEAIAVFVGSGAQSSRVLGSTKGWRLLPVGPVIWWCFGIQQSRPRWIITNEV